MAERAVFLDRDNTIIANDGYLGDPTKVRLMQGAATAIAALRRLGYRMIVVSNQSGVARGMFDESAVEAVNQEMCKQLREQAGAHVDASYYCPFHPEAVIAEYKLDHAWRKPRPGMLTQAAEDFALNLRQCWMIGDQPRDIAAGAAAGCRTILLRAADAAPSGAVEADGTQITPNFIVTTLADAARVIAREGFNPAPEVSPLPLGDAARSADRDAADEAAEAPAIIPALPHAKSEQRDTAGENTSHGAAVDVDALADRVAARLGAVNGIDSVRPTLEEMLQQLRQRNRDTHLPEFSLTRMAAAIVQALVPFLLFMAAWDALNANDVLAGRDVNWWYNRTSGQLMALIWLVAALVLQAMAIALNLGARNK